MTALLTVDDLQVAYGRIIALRGVSLAVDPGEFVAVTGANGAGKSTLLKAILGLLPPRAGTIALDGTPIQGQPTARLVQRGLALVPEGRQVFAALTVRENLVLGAYRRLGLLRAGAAAADLARIYALFPRLAERQQQRAGTLSGGEQQMLALGRALMARPRLLLCDEPSLGLAPLVVREIFQTLRQLCAEGTAVLLAEQHARVALEYADRGYVLEVGRVALSGAAAALRADGALTAAYLGASAASPAAGDPHDATAGR